MVFDRDGMDAGHDQIGTHREVGRVRRKASDKPGSVTVVILVRSVLTTHSTNGGITIEV